MDHHNIIQYNVDGRGNDDNFCWEVKTEEYPVDIEPKLEPVLIKIELPEVDKQKPVKCEIDTTGEECNSRENKDICFEVKIEEHRIDIQIKLETEHIETVPTNID